MYVVQFWGHFVLIFPPLNFQRRPYEQDIRIHNLHWRGGSISSYLITRRNVMQLSSRALVAVDQALFVRGYPGCQPFFASFATQSLAFFNFLLSSSNYLCRFSVLFLCRLLQCKLTDIINRPKSLSYA